MLETTDDKSLTGKIFDAITVDTVGEVKAKSAKTEVT